MEAKLLKESFIRQRSEQLEIPLDQFLAAVIVENFIWKIQTSDFKKVIWLKNTNYLQIENYRNKVNRKIELYIKESDLLYFRKNEISRVFAELFRNVKADEIHWNYNIKETKNAIECNLSGTILSVKVPVKIIMRKIEKKELNPEEQEFSFVWMEEEKIKLQCYPENVLLIQSFIQIMQQLELISDFSCYIDIYDIVRKKQFSGRAVEDMLTRACEEQNLAIEKERFDLILSYRNYTYMKKKWKTYLRHEKKTEPDWESMMDMLENFFKKIWDSMCENMIYLGDWIPEIGRYID